MHTIHEKPDDVKRLIIENYGNVVPWSRDQIVQLVRAITGWQTNVWELLKAAERGVMMARVFRRPAAAHDHVSRQRRVEGVGHRLGRQERGFQDINRSAH